MIANVVRRIVSIHSTVYRVPTLAMEEQIAGRNMRKRKQ